MLRGSVLSKWPVLCGLLVGLQGSSVWFLWETAWAQGCRLRAVWGGRRSRRKALKVHSGRLLLLLWGSAAWAPALWVQREQRRLQVPHSHRAQGGGSECRRGSSGAAVLCCQHHHLSAAAQPELGARAWAGGAEHPCCATAGANKLFKGLDGKASFGPIQLLPGQRLEWNLWR